MTTSAIYLRISADKGKGTGEAGLAVDRQEAGIRKMLAKKGWTAGQVYTDNDTTASGKRRRPEYERMVADFKAGEIQAISAWDLDRLWRVPTEFEGLLDLVDKQGLMLATVGGDADLSTDNGILYARIKVAVAADELRKRAARQRAKFAQDREAGKDHWRGRRPFGLQLDGSLNTVEAEAVREVAAKVLDGATLASCVNHLNDLGVLTTFGRPWLRHPLKRLLLHPRLIGKMEHEGELVPGNWEAVLDETTWLAVGQVLAERPATQTKNTEKEYLLSGIATCYQCGSSAYGARVRREGKGRKELFVYRCSDISGHFSKTMDPTDRYVIERTLALISVPGAEQAYSSQTSDTDITDLRNARAAELQDWSKWQQEAAEEGMRPSEYRKPRELHEKRLSAIDASILDYERDALFSDLFSLEAESEEQLKEAWASLPLERRRRIVRTLWKSIRIEPTAKGQRWSHQNIHLEPTEKSQELQIKQYGEMMKLLK